MGLWRELSDEWRFYRHCEKGRGPLSPLRRPGFWLMATHRYGQWAARVRIPVVGQLLRLGYLWKKLWVSGLTGVDIMVGANIGKRFHIHTCHGIIIANDVTIGDDCTVNSGVCLVHSANSRGAGTPTVGRRVRIGVGAKLLGGIAVGDFVLVGANAVVTRDVPPFSVAAGVPATCRPVPREYVDEFYNPDYPLRRSGLLPDEARPPYPPDDVPEPAGE
jgi:serine O-acetyltransferase